MSLELAETRPTRTSRGPVLNSTLIVVCQSMQALAFAGVSLFLPLIRQDLGVTFAEAGTLASATTITYALMQVPAGHLADRLDPKKLFVIGLVGVNVLSLVFALLASYPWMLVDQAVSGIFRALMFAPGMLLISRQFRPGLRSTAMGLYVAGGLSTNIILNLLGPLLIDPLGWRGLFILLSASGLVLISAFAMLGDSARPEPTTVAGGGLLRALAQPVVWLCGWIQFIRLSVVLGLTFWLPSLLVADKGFSLGVAGAVTAIAAAVTAPANIAGGWLADRLGRPLLIIGVAMAAMTVLIAVIPLLHSLAALITIISINAIFIQLYFGPLFAVPLPYVAPSQAGAVSGFGNFCANLGGFVFTFGLGAIKDATGSFSSGLWMIAAMCASGLVATLLLRVTTRRPRPDAVVPTEHVDGGGPLA